MNSLLKTLAERIPEPVGKSLSRIPYGWRLGRGYYEARRRLQVFEASSHGRQRELILEGIRSIHDWAAENHPFYKDFYLQAGSGAVSPASFEDISGIPIVTKGDLKKYPLERRSYKDRRAYLTNTGGTSGQPLVFYLDSDAFAREWAHMHYIWGRLGYRQTDLKLVFRGKNLGAVPLAYNAVHNEYITNAYLPIDRVSDAIRRKIKENPIRFLHGYPSAIYAFISHCLERERGVLDSLRSTLKGVLYASEFPAQVYRSLVDETLGVRSMSWYGHSEFSVLAFEKEKYLYAPLHSYGHAEAVPSPQGYRLVCTGYFNRICPFIRYDTGDLIEPVEDDGILRLFRIAEGRVGDFVTDAGGNRVSLTALIFGRHHVIFGEALFLQIAQTLPGKAVLIVTIPEESKLTEEKASTMMDLAGVDIEFEILLVNKPFRTKAGKVSLMVPHEQIEPARKRQS